MLICRYLKSEQGWLEEEDWEIVEITGLLSVGIKNRVCLVKGDKSDCTNEETVGLHILEFATKTIHPF